MMTIIYVHIMRQMIQTIAIANYSLLCELYFKAISNI